MAFDPKAFEQWSPAAQEKALERINLLRDNRWKPFYCLEPTCNGTLHGDWTWSHARQDQRPPAGTDWTYWLSIAGRGAGKTESGSRYTNKIVEKVPRVILIAPTAHDMRETMIEGPSGILETARPGQRPEYEPSKKRLTWPNGARGLLFSSEEPERLRGPQAYFAWLDEFAIYPDMEGLWDNLLFGLRLGKRPHALITTTPKPRPLLKELIGDPDSRISRATTYDNMHNLAPTFVQKIIKKYEGTRVGRQELYAEMLTDVEGALWSWDLIEQARIDEAPEMDRIVVAVDPAGSANKKSDETGIVVVGYASGMSYVLADESGRYSPHGWATVVKNLYNKFMADAVVVEKNYGGDMVRHTLTTSGVDARIIEIHARRGKVLRAEPVVSLYEQNKVFHIPGLNALEDELTSWIPFEGPSPNRLDAMVYGISNVAANISPATIGSPLRLVV